MKITRKREIISERERRVVVKFKDESRQGFCVDCQTLTSFVTVDEAAALRDTTARKIFRLVEAGKVHFEETADGRLFVCLPSLSGKTVVLTGKVKE